MAPGKAVIALALVCLVSFARAAPRVLYEDNFSGNMQNWYIEKEKNNTAVNIAGGKMEWRADGGLLVWFKHKLQGHIQIEYDRMFYADSRIGDMNQFWMASEPDGSDLKFGRSGKMSAYDNMRLYYAGTAAWSNTKNRFRRYPKTNVVDIENTKLIPFKKSSIYRFKIVYDPSGTTRLWINGTKIFDFSDSNPYAAGHFGFRALNNHESIDNFTVSCLAANCGATDSKAYPILQQTAPLKDSRFSFGPYIAAVSPGKITFLTNGKMILSPKSKLSSGAYIFYSKPQRLPAHGPAGVLLR